MADITTLYDDVESVLALKPEEPAVGIARFGRTQVAAGTEVDHWDPRGFLKRLNAPAADNTDASRWPCSARRELDIAVAAACIGLEQQGIVERDPGRPGGPYLMFTRRGSRLLENGGVLR